MSRFRLPSRRLVVALLFLIAGLTWLEIVNLAAGEVFSLSRLIVRLAFSLTVLAVAAFSRPFQAGPNHWILSSKGIIVLAAGVLAGILALAMGSETAAWALLAILFAILIILDRILAQGSGILRRTLIVGLLAILSGAAATAFGQIESNFAEEEFFIALQAAALGIFWLFINFAAAAYIFPPPVSDERASSHANGLCVSTLWTVFVWVSLMAVGAVVTVKAYQNSFYPKTAPVFPGISAEAPFKCATTPSEAIQYDGNDIFRRIMKLVEANPQKGTMEFGMLALGTHQGDWAQAFRASLLEEARAGLYTEAANSIKYTQYEAAARAYYYSRVKTEFPTLFSSQDQDVLNGWFVEINQRAQTVEWIDWMYALAFSKKPEGPYENQENGAGLLSLLESQGLADPALSAQNQSYLDRSKRGWANRFRNTDDVYVYQADWINNALYQTFYQNEIDRVYQRLSFLWLMLQALPDGAPLRYNHPYAASMVGLGYLGAVLLNDPDLLWLSGRALENIEARDEKYLQSIIGVERPYSEVGTAPEQGSCLLYGSSGLPNQNGPIAPDKIVFRNGWSDESTYLLLNLRFSGWHRYKATNSITLLYQSGPLLEEDSSGQTFDWLPEGRSLFRDKRIPRQNLNGFVVERTGISKVLYRLVGVGGKWAQDPPYYAIVEDFKTGPELDSSTTRIDDWRGWQQQRKIYFYHDQGPVVIWDRAVQSGRITGGGKAMLVWHIPANSVYSGEETQSRWQLRPSEPAAEMVLLTLEGSLAPSISGDSQSGLMTVPILSADGQLDLLTVFLTGDWVGAELKVTTEAAGPHLQITSGNRSVELSLGIE